MAKNNKNKAKKPTTEQVDKKPATKSKAADDILKKYGLSDEHSPSETEIEKEKEEKQQTKQKGKVPSIADGIGWNKPSIWARNALFGAFMGMSDAVPGYSGGTTLNLIGIYHELVSNAKLIFKPDVKKYFWKYLLWIIPFAVTWIGVLVGFLYLVNMAGKADKGVVLVFLFGSFSLFSIPLFYAANKNKFIDRKLLMNETKQKAPSAILHWTLFAVALAIMLTVGLVARFIPELKHDDILIQGVTFAKSNNQQVVDELIKSANDPMVIVQMLMISFVAGFVVLIPALSGGLVLFMTNWYTKISSLMSYFMETGKADVIPYLVTVGAGIALGLITSIITLNAVLKKYEQYFYSASLGFVVMAPVAIFTALSSYDYSFLQKDMMTLGLSIGMIFIALVVNGLSFIALNETKKINYPKLRIFHREATTATVKN